jgi:hypothetical protein
VSNTSKDNSFFQYESYFDKKKIRQNLKELNKSGSRSVSRDYSKDNAKGTKAHKDDDRYYFSFGIPRGIETHKHTTASRDISKDRLKESYGYKSELVKSKSTSKLKHSGTESQSSLLGSKNSAFMKSSNNLKSSNHMGSTSHNFDGGRDKSGILEKTAFFNTPHPQSTTHKQGYDFRDLTPSRLTDQPKKNKSEYTPYLSNNTSTAGTYTVYRKKLEADTHVISKLSKEGGFLDCSFSKKTFQNTQQDNFEGSRRNDIKGSTSGTGTQSTYHLEDSKTNIKKPESVEEKHYYIVAILQEMKKGLYAIETPAGGNPYDTVHRIDEMDYCENKQL